MSVCVYAQFGLSYRIHVLITVHMMCGDINTKVQVVEA